MIKINFISYSKNTDLFVVSQMLSIFYYWHRPLLKPTLCLAPINLYILICNKYTICATIF